MLQIEALKDAWGGDKFRRASLEAPYIPFLLLLRDLEILKIVPGPEDSFDTINVLPLCLMALKELEVEGRTPELLLWKTLPAL